MRGLFTPLEKIFYNLTVTIMLVLAAFVIGGLELVQVLELELKETSSFRNALENVNFETMSFAIVAIFVITWLSAYAVWKYKKYDENPTVLFDSPKIS